jgi:hypothetical protein
MAALWASRLGPDRFESLVERAGVAESWCRCNLSKSAVGYWLKSDANRRCRLVLDDAAAPMVLLGEHQATLSELIAEPLSCWKVHAVCRRGGQRIDGEFLEQLGKVLPLWSRVPST